LSVHLASEGFAEMYNLWDMAVIVKKYGHDFDQERMARKTVKRRLVNRVRTSLVRYQQIFHHHDFDFLLKRLPGNLCGRVLINRSFPVSALVHKRADHIAVLPYYCNILMFDRIGKKVHEIWRIFFPTPEILRSIYTEYDKDISIKKRIVIFFRSIKFGFQLLTRILFDLMTSH
jgi:hypothetical protein